MRDKKIVKFLDVVRYVAQHNEAYPLPDDFTYPGDEPGDIIFDLSNWCSLSKKELARQLQVEQAQISRWLRRGASGEQEDGRIVWWLFEAWLKRKRSDWWVKFRGKVLDGKIHYEGNLDLSSATATFRMPALPTVGAQTPD